jgi:F-type H+-transporting ATPase subunit gamma
MERAVKAEAFTRKIAELAADLSAAATDFTHPLMQTREQVKNVLLLVIGSNRGLCGGYNAGILREALRRAREVLGAGQGLVAHVSGRRPIAYCRYQGLKVAATYTQFEDKPTFAEVSVLATRFMEAYTSGAVDRVEVAYQKFYSAARQAPVLETLLPLSGVPTTVETTRGAVVTAAPKKVEYEFLPDARSILEELLPESFKVRLFKCFLDAAVSEQIARRVTMSAATENADEMIKTLTLQYNRARQAQITKEIAEVIGGAEALK